MPRTLRASPLTGNPDARSRPSASLCVAGGQGRRRRFPAPAPAGVTAAGSVPSTSPIWYAQNESGRDAVFPGSFWRKDPAAEFRGFTNSLVPSASARRLSSAKSAVAM